MRNKLGTICMVLGAVLVLAALSLFLWNRWEARVAEESVERVLPQVISQIEALRPEPTEEVLTGETPTAEAPTYPDPYDPTMTEVEIDGYGYIGYLSIPSAGLELPVMGQWDYVRLKIAPCRFSGSVKTDDFVICGHNYKRHFKPIHDLKTGDFVYFTDMDGVVWQYEVAAMEVLAPTDVEDMTAGDFDLTLFTCTYGGANRVAIRCERVDDP